MKLARKYLIRKNNNVSTIYTHGKLIVNTYNTIYLGTHNNVFVNNKL